MAAEGKWKEENEMNEEEKEDRKGKRCIEICSTLEIFTEKRLTGAERFVGRNSWD